jgi:hypothetical protein
MIDSIQYRGFNAAIEVDLNIDSRDLIRKRRRIRTSAKFLSYHEVNYKNMSQYQIFKKNLLDAFGSI